MDTVAFFTAKRQLNEFLEANPQLKEMQVEIDDILVKAGSNPNNRLVAFNRYMRTRLTQNQARLAEAIKGINHDLAELQSCVKDLNL